MDDRTQQAVNLLKERFPEIAHRSREEIIKAIQDIAEGTAYGFSEKKDPQVLLGDILHYVGSWLAIATTVQISDSVYSAFKIAQLIGPKDRHLIEWIAEKTSKDHVDKASYLALQIARQAYLVDRNEVNPEREFGALWVAVREFRDHLRGIRRKIEGKAVISLPEDQAGQAMAHSMNMILEALHELGAFDQASRRTRDAIAAKVDGPAANPQAFAGPIADLRALGLVESKVGRGGGTWLTDEGRKEIAKILKL